MGQIINKNEASPLAAAPAGFRRLYSKSDGWYEVNEAGVESKFALETGGGFLTEAEMRALLSAYDATIRINVIDVAGFKVENSVGGFDDLFIVNSVEGSVGVGAAPAPALTSPTLEPPTLHLTGTSGGGAELAISTTKSPILQFDPFGGIVVRNPDDVSSFNRRIAAQALFLAGLDWEDIATASTAVNWVLSLSRPSDDTDIDLREVLRVDYLGRMGLGTSALTSNMTVADATKADIRLDSLRNPVLPDDIIGNIDYATPNEGNLDNQIVVGRIQLLASGSWAGSGIKAKTNLIFSVAEEINGLYEAMRLTTEGRLGIATDSPPTILSAADSNGAEIRLQTLSANISTEDRLGEISVNVPNESGLNTGKAAKLKFQAGSNWDTLSTSDVSADLALFLARPSDDTSVDLREVLRVNYLGQLLIGTSSPGAILTVAEDGGPTISLQNLDISILADNSLGRFAWKAPLENGTLNRGDAAKIEAFATTTWTGGEATANNPTYLAFFTARASASAANDLREILRLDDLGRMGLGTTTPEGILTVAEDGGPTISVQNLNSVISLDDSLGRVAWNAPNEYVTNVGISAKIEAFASGNWLNQVNSSNQTYVAIFTAKNSTTPTTDLNERIRIHHTGELAIAMTTKTANYFLTLPNLSTHKGLAFAWDIYSGRNAKRNIIPLSSTKEQIRQLNPVSFQALDTEFEDTGEIMPGETTCGLIAEEVEVIFPEAVNRSPPDENETQDLLSINPWTITVNLIKTVQELMGEVENSQAQVETLQAQVETLQAQVETLQAAR